MRKTQSDATAPNMQPSKTSDNNQSLLNKKRINVYNKTSKAKADRLNKPKTVKVFEYYYNEYDEYLSS